MTQDEFDQAIGRLDRVLSILVGAARDPATDEANRQTLKHHAEDMQAAAAHILKKLGYEVEGTPQPPPPDPLPYGTVIGPKAPEPLPAVLEIAICLLHELGGDKTIPITTVDELPADYILKLAAHPTNVSTPTHLRVWLEEKP